MFSYCVKGSSHKTKAVAPAASVMVGNGCKRKLVLPSEETDAPAGSVEVTPEASNISVVPVIPMIVNDCTYPAFRGATVKDVGPVKVL